MKQITVVILTGLCALAQQAQPYSIKQDILGESLESYRNNNSEKIGKGVLASKRDCTIKSKMSVDSYGVSYCKTDSFGANLTYAGLPVNIKGVYFLHDRLFRVSYVMGSDFYESFKLSMA